jgi:hypothetical protein
MSTKGMTILADLYQKYREDYLTCFPDSNENEVERGFLFTVVFGLQLQHIHTVDLKLIREKISEIV